MNAEAKPILLAIDDDAVILNTVVSTLKGDYSVRPFTSGENALGFLAKQTADLILLDCQMPGMSGFEVLARLQSEPETRDIPVIFLTGAIDGDSEVEALEMGAVDFIQKPVKPRSLMTRVRLQLELQHHRRRLETMVAEKTKSLNEAYNKLKTREDVTLNLLAQVTDMRDHDTGDHIERTTDLVRIMVEHILANPRPDYTLTTHEAEDIVKSAKLHDLGKIAMPDNILLKPGRLTPDEFETIKMHPVHGEQLLNDFIRQMDDSFLNTARDIAHYHHERWDGDGYPIRLKGMQIPMAARIVAIADVYDALSSERPYKKPFSHEKSMAIIVENSGTQFDPYLVSVFEAHADEISEIGFKKEENGEA